jgi:hypothetical protein
MNNLVDGDFYIICTDEQTQLLNKKMLKDFDEYKPFVRQFFKRLSELSNGQDEEDVSPLKRNKKI